MIIRQAELRDVAQSKEALSYYEAMGFRTFQEDGMRVNKVFEVGG